MARFLYDINKTTRYIDIHKSFAGGLKTVDTDDALKDVYLREAENISLSEFNFVEKRHGTHKNDEYKPWTSIANAGSKLQGYFEYSVNPTTFHKIIAFEGHFYVNQGSGFEQVLLFDSPTGEAVDLSDLGIYTSQEVEDATDFASVIQFGTQAPWFYIGNPNGVQLGIQGQIIHSTTNFIYANTGGTSLNQTWTIIGSATFPFPSNLTQGQTYYDTRTNRLYVWNNATGRQGLLTLLTDVYAADFQATRPIDGVRIDDKLYIATGTYPVYYKGDGKIYVLPQYEMSDLDIQELGYDLNTVDLEAAFTVPALTKTSSHGTTLDGVNVLVDTVTIKESQLSRRFPYATEDVSPTEIRAALHLYNNASLNRWGGTGTDIAADVNLFDSGLTEAELTAWQGVPAMGETNTVYGTIVASAYGVGFTDRRYRVSLRPFVYIKAAGNLDSLYQESVFSEITELTNDINSGSINRLPNSTIALTNMIIKLRDLSSGYFDIKVELRLTQSGYFYPYELPLDATENPNNYARIRTKTLDIKVIEFSNIWVTPEELVDFKEEPYTSLKVHTCNRITEHNGRLCLFGSTTHPDWLFFSTISAKEYFPYRYSLQFTNDLQEPVTAVTKFMNILVVQSPTYTFGIKGDSPFPLTALEGEIYRKITINPTIGCIAPHSVRNVRNQLYFLSKEGIFTLKALFAEDLRYNVDPIDRNIYNIVPRDTDAVAAYFDDQYWLHFPQSGETLRYYVDKRAWVKDTYTPFNQFGGIHKFINESGVLRFITDLSQLEVGDPLKVFDIDIDYALPTDLTKIIVSKVTTSYLNQNQPFHPKNYKEAKFDFAIQNEYNTSMAKLPVSKDPVITTNYIEFEVPLIDRHFYSITLEPQEIVYRTFASTALFGTQAPWYVDYDPNGVLTGVDGNVVHRVNNQVYRCNGGTSWTSISSIAWPFSPTLLTQNEIFLDTRTNIYYTWLNPLGQDGQMTTGVRVVVSVDGVDVLEDMVEGTGTNLNPIRFMSNKNGLVTVTITITGGINTTNMSADNIKLYDSTYDHSVTFNTLVISEEGTLNVDPIDSYTTADVAVEIDLGTRTGNWMFGTSDFGNVIVAVKTVKLSGRGYNSKISIIEDSKSKWTLESLGITYKMKKARSR